MIWPIGAMLMIVGLFGYAGIWRNWSRDGFYYYVFGVFWFGLSVVVTDVQTLLAPLPIWFLNLTTFFFFASIVMAFYLPPCLTPRWFRAMRRTWE